LGAIFSQYFNGLYLESTEKPSVTLAELDPDARRTALIDTKVNSGAHGLLVQAAVGLMAKAQSRVSFCMIEKAAT